MTEIENKRISKFLSLILRHQPENIQLKLDENGWADVSELITKSAKGRMHFSFEDLEEVVETNNKKRFAFNEDKTRIRASQGHSIAIDLDLKAAQPPDFLYHGTAEANISSILENGIEKRTRQHVHLSADKETATKVGMRHGKPVILTIRTKAMHEAGIIFFLSANGVWLTDFVEPQYISK
ncbi:RNA 2'-phosphotransferase [Chryseobacterium phocaeense]|uniref:RNA 2'-phosphotransferase n=1 Tax=Chryseobacterium phocaeense TaxID=1816690 RepID=UPI0009BBB632|nr:RNA 2'-phosphotransferase [Chryseobacterium phocaeense]